MKYWFLVQFKLFGVNAVKECYVQISFIFSVFQKHMSLKTDTEKEKKVRER